jgi:hypothetical protein
VLLDEEWRTIGKEWLRNTSRGSDREPAKTLSMPPIITALEEYL